MGGGDSSLVDNLLKLNFNNLFVLDISAEALTKAKLRLGQAANLVNWIESDILNLKIDRRFDIWHNRAVFHFLTKEKDISGYIKTAGQLIEPAGYLIIGVFSLRGPKKCSDLDITQYSEESIKKAFRKKFNHIRSFEKNPHYTI